MARRTLRAGARAIVARRLDLEVQGLEHLAGPGPILVACRHVHHLYDGCILLAISPRPLHLLVALDWTRTRHTRRLMEWACAMACWPVVLRTERLAEPRGRSAYRAGEGVVYLRRAIREAVGLLRAGHIVVVFPEAYPNVDPVFTPKPDADAFLPFRPGFVRVVARAQRDEQTQVPIVPAGLTYRRGRRWRVTLRFGAPLMLAEEAGPGALVRAVEEQVRALSRPGQADAPHPHQEGAARPPVQTAASHTDQDAASHAGRKAAPLLLPRADRHGGL